MELFETGYEEDSNDGHSQVRMECEVVNVQERLSNLSEGF